METPLELTPAAASAAAPPSKLTESPKLTMHSLLLEDPSEDVPEDMFSHLRELWKPLGLDGQEDTLAADLDFLSGGLESILSPGGTAEHSSVGGMTFSRTVSETYSLAPGAQRRGSVE
eukprot:RCo027694